MVSTALATALLMPRRISMEMCIRDRFRRIPLCGGEMAYVLSIVEQLCGHIGRRVEYTIDGETLDVDYDFFYRKINNVAGFLICLNDQMRIIYFTDLDAVGRFVCFCKEYKIDNCR